MKTGVLIAAAVLAVCVSSALAADATCPTSGNYPVDNSRVLPKYTVDLDMPPAERWNRLITDFKPKIAELIKYFIDLVPKLFEKDVVNWLLKELDPVADELPAPYGDEIKAVAANSGIKTGEAVLYNIFYAIFSACTSIVAQNDEGEIIQGRNLDFGLFMGYDWKNHTWRVTEMLRPMAVDVTFTRDGKEVYHTVQYAGYIGVLSGMSPGKFAVTIDERFDTKLDKGLRQWMGGDHSSAWMPFLARDVLEKANSYSEAQQMLNNTALISTGYFILGGTKPGEGCVITRDEKQSLNVWTLADQLKKGKYYVLETNYDNWKKPPFFDNRRDPGMACMDKQGQKGFGFAQLANVLESKPVLNQLTTYGVLMHTKSGEFYSYTQTCKGECAPF